MTEAEKLDAGLEYDFLDEEVDGRKLHALEWCQKLNAIPMQNGTEREEAVRQLFGSVGANPTVLPVFNCDSGKNIHVGVNFLTNYNVTILDIAPVHIGDYVMIGPNTLISTVNHPLSPAGRRKHLGIAKPVHIGNDVWIGGNVTILPGVTIGNNVVVAAGAVITKDVPDNCIVGGVPATVIKEIENDIDDTKQGIEEETKMNVKKEIAEKSYNCGCTCSQAVISAYLDELGLDRETAYRLMEGFGGGFGGMQEVCGAFSAACAVISYLHSDGSVESKTKMDTYQEIQKAADTFKKKYGSIRCYDILNGERPKAFKCGEKITDAVAVIELYRNTIENGELA